VRNILYVVRVCCVRQVLCCGDKCVYIGGIHCGKTKVMLWVKTFMLWETSLYMLWGTCDVPHNINVCTHNINLFTHNIHFCTHNIYVFSTTYTYTIVSKGFICCGGTMYMLWGTLMGTRCGYTLWVHVNGDIVYVVQVYCQHTLLVHIVYIHYVYTI
jgi:hypothetical protein